mmetsp:Transcript_17901/g.40584  ORF Transcript_17901/g.40584 Transcript_17901/m.40584 type:complete len:202 (-) Transcript_17901:571-1176(-)
MALDSAEEEAASARSRMFPCSRSLHRNSTCRYCDSNLLMSPSTCSKFIFNLELLSFNFSISINNLFFSCPFACVRRSRVTACVALSSFSLFAISRDLCLSLCRSFCKLSITVDSSAIFARRFARSIWDCRATSSLYSFSAIACVCLVARLCSAFTPTARAVACLSQSSSCRSRPRLGLLDLRPPPSSSSRPGGGGISRMPP